MLMGSYMNWDSVISRRPGLCLLGSLTAQLCGLWVTCFVAFWAENYLHIIYLKVSEFMNIKDYAPVVSLKAKVDVDVFDSFLTITWPWLSILVMEFLHPSVYFLLKISRYFNLLNAAVCCFVCRHNESSCFLMMRDGFIDYIG